MPPAEVFESGQAGQCSDAKKLVLLTRDRSPCARGATRRGPVRGCRNSFAGLVMPPGLAIRRACDDSLRDGREANDAKLSQTADTPGPDHAASLEAGRHAGKNEDDSLRDGREVNDAKLSQTADNPGPDRAASLEAGRLAMENELKVMHANRITSQDSD